MMDKEKRRAIIRSRYMNSIHYGGEMTEYYGDQVRHIAIPLKPAGREEDHYGNKPKWWSVDIASRARTFTYTYDFLVVTGEEEEGQEAGDDRESTGKDSKGVADDD
jgi:hypothetical protein